MMKIFKLSLSALLLASLFISCDKGNDNPPAPNGGEGSFKGVVFAAGITNPEGNGGNVYMQALPGFLPGTYGNTNAIPVGFGSTPIVTESNNIYAFPDYMGNTKAEIKCYNLNEKGEWLKKGALQIPANAAACNIVELNKEKAYVSLQGIGIVMVFNPTTMKKIADIDLNSYAQAGARGSPAPLMGNSRALRNAERRYTLATVFDNSANTALYR